MVKFNNKFELLNFIKSLYFLDKGTQGECYYNLIDNKVYKIFSSYLEDGISYFDIDFYFKFSNVKNKTFIWMTDVIMVDNLCVGYITDYVNGMMLNQVNPLTINIDLFLRLIKDVNSDIELVSKNGIQIEDLMYNLMYSSDKINIIDFVNYYYSNLSYEELLIKNLERFNMVIYYFLIDTYFDDFIRNDINLLKMYKEKDINLEKFINLFRLKLSEYIIYKINVLGQAYLCINKLSKNSPKYIREYK